MKSVLSAQCILDPGAAMNEHCPESKTTTETIEETTRKVSPAAGSGCWCRRETT